jgi:SAM-dependent methyltransferase
MIAARLIGTAPAVQASAESLPFADHSFDASLAVLTMHHWTDLDKGLAEMRRVVRKRIVMFTWDPEFVDALWFRVHYLPRYGRRDQLAFPSLARLAASLGEVRVTAVPIPHDCSDGFMGAWWRRPEAYLDPEVRAGISCLSFVEPGDMAAALERLRSDLENGEWDRRFGYLRELEELDLGYRLVVAEVA